MAWAPCVGVRGAPVAHPRFSRALMDVIVGNAALFTVTAQRGGNPPQVCYFAMPRHSSVDVLASRFGGIYVRGRLSALRGNICAKRVRAGRNLDTHDHFFGEAGL